MDGMVQTLHLERRIGYNELAFGQASTEGLCIWETLRVVPFGLIVP